MSADPFAPQERVELIDVTGRSWLSDPPSSPITDAQRDAIAELVSNWSSLHHLVLEVDGTEVRFNPANVICLRLVKR